MHFLPDEFSLHRLASILVGMANASGGVVIIGVTTRTGQILGVDNPELVIDRIFQAVLLADPPLVLPIPSVESLKNAKLIRIVIPPGLPNLYSLDGRYLCRQGTQINPMPARELRKLLAERGITRIESQSPPGATTDDIDWDKAEEYLDKLELPATEPIEISLLQRGCLIYVSTKVNAISELTPTYAGLLMFGRSPQRWLPNAIILATRFPGTEFTDHYIKQEITGTLPEQLKRAEQFVLDNLQRVVRLTGLMHQETSEYPLKAVRELLVNAVAHRDYNIQGDCIHLNIFSDRIEIHSPGELPGPVNLSNLLEARFSRNAVIVQILSDMRFMERLGYGLDRVVEVTRRYKMHPPKFEEVAGTFRAALFGERSSQDLAQSADIQGYSEIELNLRQQEALRFLVTHKRISSRDYQQLCPDIHPESLRRDLADMVSRGLLIKIGDKRATYYILKRIST